MPSEPPDDSFADLTPPTTPPDWPTDHPLTTIADLTHVLGQWLGDQGRVELESGFTSNLGMQYRIVAYIPKYGFRDSLSEAYVPPEGWPVKLNFFDPQSHFESIGSPEKLRARLTEWVNSEPIQQRLAQLIALARRAAAPAA